MSESKSPPGQFSEIIDSIGKVVDIFYSHFILRDILGKALPACALVVPIAFSFLGFNKFEELLAQTSFWIALLSISWCFAFFIQEVGLKSGVIIRSFDYDKEYYRVKIDFNRRATASDRNQLERVIVVRETCGIASISIALGAIYWTIYAGLVSDHDISLFLNWRSLAACSGVVILIFGFGIANWMRAKRYDDIIRTQLHDSNRALDSDVVIISKK